LGLFGQETLIKTLLGQKKPHIMQGLPMMKKTFVTVAFLSVLLMSTGTTTRLVNLGTANPFSQTRYESVPVGEMPPPNGTKPHTIQILFPENNTAIGTYNFTLAFNVTAPAKNKDIGYFVLSKVYYKASWLSGTTSVDLATSHRSTFSIHVAGVPNGKNTITVYAVGTGGNETWRRFEYNKFPPVVYIYYLLFSVIGSSVVSFTVDTVRPKVSILSQQNATYISPDFPLSVAVNENASISYGLDGQDNVTVSGNTTLRGLPNGGHNVTVYATDEAGNVGASETIYFTIESSPATMVIAPIALAAVIGMCLLIYVKKHQKKDVK
jgi:hypothetical protein